MIMSDRFYPHPLFLLFLFIALPAAAQSDYLLNCPSYSCGDVTISYPFWRIDTSTSTSPQPTGQFCGYEGFGITCSTISDQRSIPQITFGGDSYHVYRIDYENSSIILADYDVSSVVPLPDRECPRVRHGINLRTLPLNYTTNNVNLSFHFNCTLCPFFASEIPCLKEVGNDGRKSCVHVINATTEEVHWGEFSCADQVVTTVIGEHIDLFPNISAQFGNILEKGFQLEWLEEMDGCDKCEASEGRCGHNNRTGFICFCPDGSTHRIDCKVSKINLRRKLAIGVGSTIMSFVIISIICFIWKSPSNSCVASLTHKTEDDKNIEAFVIHYGSLSTKRYTYKDIKKMTNSFRVKLGQGGFGTVFKGKLSDDRLVAVKVLNSSKANGQEFINEVASIGRTSHVNIVTLLGFCFDYKKRALVYEYMPNGSLEKFIHNHAPLEASEHIGVNKLYEIARGIACGLDYLHRGCNTRILHLDIKPHNILLDEDFCPKIADFGLAKLYSRKESIVSMLEARGTIGYIAPEVYNKNFGGVSHKSDVYSYGMLLLEMVGGRRNIEAGVGSGRTSEIYVPDWIYKRLNKHEFLLDSVRTIEENDCARKMTIVGLWCIQPAPNQRPAINEVIEMLEGSTESLEVPPKPFFSSPPQSPATIYSSSKAC